MQPTLSGPDRRAKTLGVLGLRSRTADWPALVCLIAALPVGAIVGEWLDGD
ncbi:MAG: hypothetical protein OYL92_10635 [Acidobacteriota bacterium]|nr:hypothetical protein [Acidobacteriota bacterium]